MASPSQKRRKDKYTSQGFLVGFWAKQGGFLGIPKLVLSGPDVRGLSHAEFRVFVAIVSQYQGNNNGDLCATEKIMSEEGVSSPDTINRAIKVLLAKGLIVKTQNGGYSGKDGKRKPALYALSWLPIDSIDRRDNGSWVQKIKGTRTPLRTDFDQSFSGNISYEAV